MFQKGTGERFKYKAAVINKLPNAHSESVFISRHRLYAIFDKTERISEAFLNAENAWADAWVKKVK